MKYKLCYKCDTPYTIPGIDASYCQGCGWVDDLIWTQEQVRLSEQKARKKKRSTSIREEAAA